MNGIKTNIELIGKIGNRKAAQKIDWIREENLIQEDALAEPVNGDWATNGNSSVDSMTNQSSSESSSSESDLSGEGVFVGGTEEENENTERGKNGEEENTDTEGKGTDGEETENNEMEGEDGVNPETGETDLETGETNLSGEGIEAGTQDEMDLDIGSMSEEDLVGGGNGEMGAQMGMGTTETKESFLTNWVYVGGISAATFAVGAIIGVLLAVKKIKKGIELYED